MLLQSSNIFSKRELLRIVTSSNIRKKLDRYDLLGYTRKTTLALQTPPVIDRHRNLLFGPEVAFGGLNGRMPEQELDLLEVPARLAAQLGTGPAQVMGAEVLEPISWAERATTDQTDQSPRAAWPMNEPPVISGTSA